MSAPGSHRRAPYQRCTALLVVLLLGAIIATRALDATAFVTWDEPAWTYRSARFLVALTRGDLRGTALTGHPGVTTTWLGALGLAWHAGVARTIDWSQILAVDALATLDVHDAATMRLLGALLPAAKSALPLAHAAIALGIYGLLRRLAGRGPAIAAVAVLAADPYYLALSRVLHIDALTAGLMLVALLAALVYVGVGQSGARQRRYLLLSGAAAGLAVLTKTYGAAVAPCALAALVTGTLWPRRAPGASDASAPPGGRRLRAAGRDVALWGGTAVGAFVAAWPAMWVAPVETLRGVLGLSLEYATAPGDATASFFRGALTAAPGVAFYPVALFYRATPLVLVGLVLALASAASGLARGRRGQVGTGPVLASALLAYTAVHVALITISAKKFDRYLLPALLALDVVAAIGWLAALRALRVARWRRILRWDPTFRWSPLARALPAGGVTALAIVQAALLLAPLSLSHAIACYNPWAGGLAGAMRTLPVGWGEGIEEAARHLAALPNAERLRVATWAVAGVAPHFPGHVDKPTAASLPNADYVVVYVGDVQSATPLAAAFREREPAFVARVGDEPYAWVYANTFGEDLARAATALATAEGDAVIVLNAPSAFERQYTGAMRWGVVTGDSAAVAHGLATVLQGATDVVYVAYEGQPAHPHIRRLLARNGLLLAEQPFAVAGCQATLYRYRLLTATATLRSATPETPASATFGGELTLEGYGLSADAIEYRQELGIALRWRALAAPSADYHASVRLVDAAGRTWGQYDAPLADANGQRATAWAPGTEHTVDLPLSVEPGAPPGTYHALLSLYRLEDLALLEVAAGDGRPTRQVDLGPVGVGPATAPPEDAELDIPQRTDVPVGDHLRLLGYGLSREVVPSGEEVAVTLYWRCLQSPGADYDLLLEVLTADGHTVGSTRGRPVGDGHPTDRWRPGEVLRATHTVPIDPHAASGTGDVVARLVPHGAADGRAVAAVPLTSVTIAHVERLFEAPPIASPLTARFGEAPGGAIALLGYALAEDEVAPGETLHLTLYWQAIGAIDRSYTAFVHLLDGAGAVRGQRDSVPVEGARPTDGWLPGEVIVDAYAFAVAEDAPAGAHQIEIGLYDATSGARLPVTAADGTAIPERRLLLDHSVTVRP